MNNDLSSMKYSNQLQNLPDSYAAINDDETLKRIQKIKTALGENLVILGHNYQTGKILSIADHSGDSYELAKVAAATQKAQFIVFCGVIFMAESADILTSPHQRVIIPSPAAACPMAGMAELVQVSNAWNNLQDIDKDHSTVPVTYMNSYASIKSFCGARGGAVCTSSNAKKLFEWGLYRYNRLFFFPDEHLGRNTAYELGFSEKDLAVWNPWAGENGGLSPELIRNTKIMLWAGNCQVHQRLTTEDVVFIREHYPEARIIVHPECNREVVEQADASGSTGQIIKAVESSKPDSIWAIGTECHLVDYLKKQHPDKQILQLGDRLRATCRAMSMVTPQHVLWVLDKIAAGDPVNIVRVDKDIAQNASKALNRMIEITSSTKKNNKNA